MYRVVLLLLSAACLAAGSPRVRRNLFNFPGGVPVELLFATCQSQGAGDDFGPCLAELLRGIIENARPDFADPGVEIRDKHIVLEPLRIDDVDPKDREFSVGATDLLVHGISNLVINNITFSPERLALDLSFSRLRATGKLQVKYLFITASPDVEISLDGLRVRIEADWELVFNEQRQQLDAQLSNADVDFELADLAVQLTGLGSLGRFAETVLNRNSKTLVRFIIPDLERSVSKKINERLNRFKVAS